MGIMMKFKATKKDMKDNHSRIVKVGYCDAQFLLKYEEPIAYSTRSEGWACDYYDVDHVLISTGYAPIESRNTHGTHDMVRNYDKQAEAIACNYTLRWEEQRKQIRELLTRFISEVV